MKAQELQNLTFLPVFLGQADICMILLGGIITSISLVGGDE